MRFAPVLTVLAAVVKLVIADSSDSQYWHEKYHGVLSMAAYGDYNTLCPLYFTEESLLESFPDSTEEPWTVIEEWGPTESGMQGFSVVIPEMDKVVMVFKGIFGWESQFNMSAAQLTELNLGDRCGTNCTAHQGALTAYLEAKDATNDWEVVKEYVNTTGHQWSVTGHGFGGMVAQVAALDLGWRDLCHWSHNHGAARVFSPAAAAIYNSLFEGEAGQRTVANDDSVPTIIPESDDYTFTLQGFHITGNGTDNSTYGMSYVVCGSEATDPNCLGGSNITDHLFYYTPLGMCSGSSVSYNATLEAEVLSSASSSFWATATVSPLSTTTTSASSSSAISTATTSPGASSIDAAASLASASSEDSQTTTTLTGSSTAPGLSLRTTAIALLLPFGVAWFCL